MGETQHTEVDDELTQLLGEINSEASTGIDESDDPDPGPDVDEQSVSEPEPVEEPEIEQVVHVPAPAEPLPQAPIDDEEDNVSIALTGLATQFAHTVNQVLEDADSDREQLESAISYLDEVVRTGETSGVIVEQWVAALGKKADINIQKTKLLDSIAKLLAAAKNNPLIDGTASGDSGDIDFEDVLSQPEYVDEDEH